MKTLFNWFNNFRAIILLYPLPPIIKFITILTIVIIPLGIVIISGFDALRAMLDAIAKNTTLTGAAIVATLLSILLAVIALRLAKQETSLNQKSSETNNVPDETKSEKPAKPKKLDTSGNNPYIPGYQHDIFVSYARMDNQDGWVTTLVNWLQERLGQQLGQNAYSLWMDEEARDNTSLPTHIAEKLENSATLLLILSENYLESQSCCAELDTFLAKADKKRIFLVKRELVQKMPEAIGGLIGYTFWARNKEGKPYTLGSPQEELQKLKKLSHSLTNKLEELKTGLKSEPKATVFLAEVTEDLEEQRDQVKRYLERRDVQVLPEEDYPWEQFQQYLDRDLEKCQLFVQLLSDKSDKDLFHFPQFQYERACERAKVTHLPILQWRDPALDLEQIQDTIHLELLENHTVMATVLVEFQKAISNQLQKKPNTANKPNKDDTLVFVDAIPDDMLLARQIYEYLKEQQIACMLPLAETATPTEIQESLEDNLQICNAVIVIYSDSSYIKWIRKKLRAYRKAEKTPREQPFKVIAIYNHDPCVEKLSVDITFPNLHQLDCPTPQSNTCLPCFIQMLTAYE